LQWNEPTKPRAYTTLFKGGILLLIGTVAVILRQCWKQKFGNTQQQQQHPVTSLNSEEQQQATMPLETPSPAYNEVVRWPLAGETRT
jgi:hypothetical protein